MADDTEVARYVVGKRSSRCYIYRLYFLTNCLLHAGYLLQNSYSQTMQAFLQECKQLNGATITVKSSLAS